jgi:hypothetical protein
MIGLIIKRLWRNKMEPIKIDNDVTSIVARTMTAIEGLKARIEQEIAGLLRIAARIYGIPPEESEFLGVALDKDQGFWLFDTRYHAVVDGKIIELPKPSPLDTQPLEVDTVKPTNTHTNPETGDPLIARA